MPGGMSRLMIRRFIAWYAASFSIRRAVGIMTVFTPALDWYIQIE
jgi:hypothetical protein